MKDLSYGWLILITAITVLIFVCSLFFLKDARKKMLYFMLLASVYIYSGAGIAFNFVEKKNIIYYSIFCVVLSFSYCIFVNAFSYKAHLKQSNPSLKQPNKDSQCSVWDSKAAKIVCVSLMSLYLLLQFVSLLYPVNHLADFKLEYDSNNNLNNLTGANSTIITSLAAIISPFFYIGLTYIFQKTRYIVAFLVLKSAFTLVRTGYLSRHEIVVIIIIGTLLFLCGDLQRQRLEKRKIIIRGVVTISILLPITASLLLYLMSARLSGAVSYSLMQMIRSEIAYPQYYSLIHNNAPLASIKDFALQLLDSFVPILPTPSYQLDLNVQFSSLVLGLDLYDPGFYIKLPSIMGEALLLFGRTWFWVHAIIIAFMTSMIYALAGKNKHLTVLFYYYVTCVLKTGRAGYIELSQSVWLNCVMIILVSQAIRLLNKYGGVRKC